jgi:hypothetical protein
MRPPRFCVAVVLGLLFASSPAVAADADAGAAVEPPPGPPGLYLRGMAGPQAFAYGYGLASYGGELSLAVGWAVGPHTALGVDLATHYGRVFGAWPSDRWIEVIGAHAVVMADHYLWGTRGWHGQLGAGVVALASTGGESNGVEGNVPQTNDQSPAPVFVAGAGYDWTDVGLVARVESISFLGKGPHMVPVGFLVGASLLHF